ncbi:MAG TPA: SAM-dependent methyltransferase [Kineosporiaceae bacterium]|nr:SAM-dependent methyltransferase [Kineosporiaceae bacterium]
MARDAEDRAEPEFDWSWTEEEIDWVPPAVDSTKPSVARMYDYYLGGKDNFAVDREAAESVARAVPATRLVAMANRQFLVNAVRAMSEAGVRQFIDLGTGIPTSPNVHEIARDYHPDARVVYVDYDPVVLVHNRALLSKHKGVVTIMQDLRQPSAVLSDPALQGLIDFSEPVGLLCIAVLHFVGLDLAPEIMTQYRKVMMPGSYLAVSAASFEGLPLSTVRELESIYSGSNANLVFRTQSQIEQLFEGFELLDPGLTLVTRWRTEGEGGEGATCGVGRKL